MTGNSHSMREFLPQCLSAHMCVCVCVNVRASLYIYLRTSHYYHSNRTLIEVGEHVNEEQQKEEGYEKYIFYL